MSDNKLEVESSTFYLGKLSNNIKTTNSNNQNEQNNDDDDDEEYNDDDYNEGDFDEKDELEVALNKIELISNNQAPIKKNINASYDSIDTLDNDQVDSQKKQLKSIPNDMGKSTFYFPQGASESIRNINEDDGDLVFLPKSYFDEKLVFSLKNVNCIYSTVQRTDIPNVCGKLLLTNYRLIFLPYEADKQNIDPETWTKIFLVEKRLQLFNHYKFATAVIIPYSFIYEIKASSVSSDKYKKLKSFLDPSNSIVKDLIIKCKNFFTKCFILNDPSKNVESISRLITSLLYYSNYQTVIHTRFHNLIHKLNINKEILSKTETSNSSKKLRYSYLVPNDLQQDLIDSKCDEFIHVKSGFLDLNLNGRNFLINTNMPFFGMAKNISELIMRRRVVLNEANVYEFVQKNIEQINRNSTLSQFATKTSKIADFLGTSSRGTTKQVPVNSPLQYNPPIIAGNISSNPFHENKFPIWSYTHPITNSSLIVIPEAISNKQEDADIILKNFLCDEINKMRKFEPTTISVYKVKYCDYEFFKFQVPFSYLKISTSFLKLMELCSYKSISEFDKEYEKNSFHTRLNSTKWLRNISTILALTTKITNSLYVYQRNVFLEELKNNLDCSCILASLVKICLDKKFRTIPGLEDLIQKEWFLVGHPFSRRLQSPYQLNSNSDDYVLFNENDGKKRGSSTSLTSIKTTIGPNSEQSNIEQSKSNQSDISPTFLLFLDCLFQLTIQYPNEFEYNEFYLINLWDYSCSGISFSYSFNGIADWSYYLNNQIFIDSTNLTLSTSMKGTIPKFEDEYLKYLFDTNNHFWLDHLKSSDSSEYKINKSFLNKNFSPSDLVLIPNDKIYLIKFWSRCYLRWLEKFHSYNTIDEEINNQVKQDENSTVYAPSRPPPLPPKPPKQAPLERAETLDLEKSSFNNKCTKNDDTLVKKNDRNEVVEELTSF